MSSSIADAPMLLADSAGGPSFVEHQRAWPTLRQVSLDELLAATRAVNVRGRGGAGFAFARKLQSLPHGQAAVVVVNGCEGEPLSLKDKWLLGNVPHRVLDGAELVARATRARRIDVVVEAGYVTSVLEQAVAERAATTPVRIGISVATGGFVGGQSSAVAELLAGRANLPVTSTAPLAVRGVGGKPTLLSNAETFAHVAAVVGFGVAGYRSRSGSVAGTTLLTVHRSHQASIVEVAYGTPWTNVLTTDELAGPVLLGGYHGTWVREAALSQLTVDYDQLHDHGFALGAGVVWPAAGRCPIALTLKATDVLAAASARRCGPCLRGLPALGHAVREVARNPTADAAERMLALCSVVDGRGACAHPDGTARFVRTAWSALGQAWKAHSSNECGCALDSIGGLVR